MTDAAPLNRTPAPEAGVLTSRARFLAACQGEPLDRPPLWVMRQAGRYLPEYRALKAQHGFLGMVKTPELAAEVTLQPLRRFALDAAILFSDILVIPEALGQGYRFRDEGGIAMDYRLENAAAIGRLGDGTDVPERLAYVDAALRLLKAELGDQRALLGFGGSPWTLATYMVEGGSSENFSRIKGLFYSERALFERLMDKLCAALIAYFKLQIAAGVDAIQIFDSWGGALAAIDYVAGSLRWIRRIVAALPPNFPVILYAKGTAAQQALQAASGIRVLSLDSSVNLPAVHDRLSGGPRPIALQGNLDPVLLTTTPAIVQRETHRMLESMRGRSGYIVNLGHGILPDAKLENMQALVDATLSWKEFAPRR